MRRGEFPIKRHAAAPVAYPDEDAGDGGRRFFGDVSFPARKGDLYASAVEHGAPAEFLDAIRRLPSEWYSLPNDMPDIHAEIRRLASRKE